jgi:DNA-binding FadR family transcriptional regulator
MVLSSPGLPLHLIPSSLRGAPGLLAEYEAITGAGEEGRLAPRVAMAIEDALGQAGWPVGRVYGPEAALADSFDVSTRVLRQAFRILEARGACRPRRGPSGGLLILAPQQGATAAAMANHLRWTGVEDEEIWAARDFIEPLAAASAAQAYSQGKMMARVSCSSILALAPSFLGLSLACLEQFAEGMSSAPTPLVQALCAAIAQGAAERAFDLAQEGLKIRRGSGLRVVSMSAPSVPSASLGSNLAAGVAARIGADIDPDACRNGDLLGTIWSLSERYAVSPGVMTEAVRLLEDAGVAQSIKGRGGGVRLRMPDRAAIITTVHGYLTAHAVAPEAELFFRLNTWASERAAHRRSVADTIQLGQLWKLVEAAPEPVMMRTWVAMQRRLYEIADNRPLHLLAVCFAGFTVRNQAPERQRPDPLFGDGIREAGQTIVRGVVERNARLTRQGHDRARAILIPEPPRLLRA